MKKVKKAWNDYMIDWQESKSHQKYKFIGENWLGMETFRPLLNEYASKDKIALEIGCGGGRIVDEFAPKFKFIYGIDISGEAIKRCRQDVMAKNVEFRETDGFSLDGFKDESIDLVYSNIVFIHLRPFQIYLYLREIERVLKKGGIGIIHAQDFVQRFNDFKRQSLVLYERRIMPPLKWVYYITKEMFYRMLDDLNLKALETRGSFIVVFEK